MDWDKASAELNKKLDPKHVRKPTGSYGPKGDYLEGWFVINEANRIFGFDGWSYTIDMRQDDLREGLDGKGNPQWQAAYTCICTVTVGGVTRQDVGFGSGFAKGIGDAIEGATKESATDALKRCLRTFGNPFGLALYDRTRENVGVDTPVPTNAEIAAAVTRIEAAHTGREMLAVVGDLGPLNDSPAIATARVETLRRIVKGAQATAALDALAKAFAPDWQHVKADAEARAAELTEGKQAA